MKSNDIKIKVRNYYSTKIKAYGPTHKGVDWKTKESQELRFEQLIKIINFTEEFTLNDLGCGYGALFHYLKRKTSKFNYLGYDISTIMIKKAKELICRNKNCQFKTGDKLKKADYTIASGIFNVKMDINKKNWNNYLIKTLHQMNNASRKAFSFNVLTSYSDYKKEKLFYADPLFIFDYCKTYFSKNIAILHDYGLYEFTVLIRK